MLLPVAEGIFVEVPAFYFLADAAGFVTNPGASSYQGRER